MSELVCRTLELLAESKEAFASAVKNIFDTKTMETLKISDLSVGDWVWWYWLGSCVTASGKFMGYRKGKDKIIYAAISTADGTVYIEENRLFPTKEELLKSL